MEAIAYYSSGAFTAGDYYDWAIRGGHGHNIPGLIIRAILGAVPSKEVLKGGTLLDLGSGPGTSFPPLLKEFYFKKCIAVDGTEKMLSFIKARSKYIEAQIELQCKDLRKERIDLEPSSVDVAICCDVLQFLGNITNLFSEVSRLLKPEGYYGVNIATYKEGNQDVYEQNGNWLNLYGYHEKHLRKVCKENSLKLISSSKVGAWEQEHNGIMINEDILLFQKM